MIDIVAKMSRSSFYSDYLKSFDYERIRHHHSQAVKNWWTPKRRAEQRQRKLGKKVPKLSQSINNLWEQGIYDNRKSSTDAQKKRWQKDRNKLVKKFKETRNDPAYRQSQSQRMKLWWQERKS